MHDGSRVMLKKLEHDYDPTNRAEAMRLLEEANAKRWLLTGLIYINTEQPSLLDIYNLTATPLNRLKEPNLRPKPESIVKVNNLMF
jgi:2-oxoglutarate ferredoxin oxidoreductase subunit beta